MTDVYNYILDTGLIVPDTADIQAQVQQEYINAFGNNLDVADPNTPQGLLINAETQARIAASTNNAVLANQINPNLAGGVFLDAILALMGSERTPATNSLVTVTVTGVAGTIIPQGALAQDANGNEWQSINMVTIPPGGTLNNVSFNAVDTGPIIVTSGQLNIIISNVIGWETISNPAGNAIIGQNTQSDISARQYRINTLYLQSNGLAGSIIAALTATETVKSLYFIENPSSSPATIQGVAMNANSIYCCIDGTNQQAIAATLTATKSAGCAYTNGASASPVSYNYSVPISGQVIDVLWDNPDLIEIAVNITVTLYTPVQDYVTTVKNAILNYAEGFVDGLRGLVVGANVSPFEISAAVGIQFPGIYVANCEISKKTTVTQTGTVINTMATVTGLTDATVLLYPGMSVSDGAVNIPGGTKILSITNDTTIVMTANATGGATESITFSGVGVFEAATIDISPWELAQISAGDINVSTT